MGCRVVVWPVTAFGVAPPSPLPGTPSPSPRTASPWNKRRSASLRWDSVGSAEDVSVRSSVFDRARTLHVRARGSAFRRSARACSRHSAGTRRDTACSEARRARDAVREGMRPPRRCPRSTRRVKIMCALAGPTGGRRPTVGPDRLARHATSSNAAVSRACSTGSHARGVGGSPAGVFGAKRTSGAKFSGRAEHSRRGPPDLPKSASSAGHPPDRAATIGGGGVGRAG